MMFLLVGVFLATGRRLVTALVDEHGRYRAAGNLDALAPPEPSAEDRSAAMDLSKQPIEKLFRLLAFELYKEERRPDERQLGLREFQVATELDCTSRLLTILQEVSQVNEEVKNYHLNVTGTVGLFWLFHEYPEERSWAWMLAISHERLIWKVNQHFLRLEIFTMDDPTFSCISPQLRIIFMNSATNWRKLHGDYIALLWNGVAFGMLGDVTSWREIDNETDEVQDGPGGPPPNVSWSENIIFGNMWASSVGKFFEYHAGELTAGLHAELARLQAGLQPGDAQSLQWVKPVGGTISAFEYLRRQTWGVWELDKGLLRGLLRYVFQPDYYPVGEDGPPLLSVGEFGAGGGQYSRWLNETGLAHAFAFDSTHPVGDITGGAVQELDFTTEIQLWRSFHWLLFLSQGGLGRHGGTVSGAVLQNARRHVERGVVMAVGPGQAEASLIAAVDSEAGLALDHAATASLRQSCELSYFANSVMVFRV